MTTAARELRHGSAHLEQVLNREALMVRHTLFGLLFCLAAVPIAAQQQAAGWARWEAPQLEAAAAPALAPASGGGSTGRLVGGGILGGVVGVVAGGLAGGSHWGRQRDLRG